MNTLVKPFTGYGDELKLCRGLTPLQLSQKDGRQAIESVIQMIGAGDISFTPTF